ncbi:hypothetical protein [Rickettsia endosymbiont of Polydrusus tereticollis]|uniref:hypothetical protein n=1 Tax=Rickettsia endosymbiont of Polydrusus tereticollis TaxID=3066251 RepID=UPI003132EE0B
MKNNLTKEENEELAKYKQANQAKMAKLKELQERQKGYEASNVRLDEDIATLQAINRQLSNNSDEVKVTGETSQDNGHHPQEKKASCSIL